MTHRIFELGALLRKFGPQSYEQLMVSMNTSKQSLARIASQARETGVPIETLNGFGYRYNGVKVDSRVRLGLPRYQPGRAVPLLRHHGLATAPIRQAAAEQTTLEAS